MCICDFGIWYPKYLRLFSKVLELMQLINLPDWNGKEWKEKNTHTNSFGRWRQYNAVLSICLACCAMHIATFGKLVDICCLFTNASVIMHCMAQCYKVHTPHQLYHHRWMLLPYLNPMHSTLQIKRNDNKHIWSYCMPLRFFFSFFLLESDFVGDTQSEVHTHTDIFGCSLENKTDKKKDTQKKSKTEEEEWSHSVGSECDLDIYMRTCTIWPR